MVCSAVVGALIHGQSPKPGSPLHGPSGPLAAGRVQSIAASPQSSSGYVSRLWHSVGVGVSTSSGQRHNERARSRAIRTFFKAHSDPRGLSVPRAALLAGPVSRWRLRAPIPCLKASAKPGLHQPVEAAGQYEHGLVRETRLAQRSGRRDDGEPPRGSTTPCPLGEELHVHATRVVIAVNRLKRSNALVCQPAHLASHTFPGSFLSGRYGWSVTIRRRIRRHGPRSSFCLSF